MAGTRRRSTSGRMASLLAGALLLACGPAGAVAPAPFVMATDQPETTLVGRWYRRVTSELFRRLGLPHEIVVAPIKRMGLMVADGIADGELWRAEAYGREFPALVRVDESVTTIRFALYTADPALKLSRVEDLVAAGLTGTVRRGVVLCEQTLGRLLPAARFGEVASTAQGLRQLLSGRADFHCDTEPAVVTELRAPEFRGNDRLRWLVGLGAPVALYPYLNPKHAALAPRMAAAIRQMKAEGLIERYRREAEDETR